MTPEEWARRRYKEYATLEQKERALERAIRACPNLFMVARALRQVFDKTEREELVALLLEEIVA